MKNFMFGALCLAVAGCCECNRGGSDASAVSSDGRNEIRLFANPLAYEVLRDGVVVVGRTPIGMKVDGRCLCEGAKLESVDARDMSGSVDTPIYKKAKIGLAGEETFADFGSWGVRLAARKDGVAYRFETKKSGRITVNDELAAITIPGEKAKCWVNCSGRYGCEETVNRTMTAPEAAKATLGKEFAYLPLVYSVGGKTVAVTESDVYDYPVWNLRAKADAWEVKDAAGKYAGVRLGPDFARWPTKQVHVANVGGWSKLVEQPTGGRWVRVKATADYLVETEGTRTFPWRTFVLADWPIKLCEADIVYALARPKADYDFSWVKPGKVAWDWWNCWNNLGEAKGCTTAGYKRYIDFAAKNNVEYVILDEGWSEALNIWKFHPNVDVPEIIRYGNEKGVGIILWMAWAQVYGDEARVAEHFSKLGAKGFKVDFMDRGDADVERFLWKFADECAKRKMLVDYHGAHRPTGQQRAYPNVINFEGVHGLECMKFYRNEDFMDNDLKVFFCRMTAGPMDYTPGAMDNYKIGEYKGTHQNPGSMGTRCRQMAMMAMYEAPLQMLCDSPSKYEDNLECFKFMSEVPTVWDETCGISGAPDTYAVIARRKGDVWYVAGITDDQSRYAVVDTKFLGPKGEAWKAEIFRDGLSTSEYPMQYVHETMDVKAGKVLSVKFARGGGFIIRFSK